MASKKSKETVILDSIYVLPNDSIIEFPSDDDRLKIIEQGGNMTPMDYSIDLIDKSVTVRDRHSRIILNYYDDNASNKKGVDLVPQNVGDFLEEMASDPLKIIDFLTERIQYQSLELNNTSKQIYQLHERTTRDIRDVLSGDKGASLDGLLRDERMVEKISSRMGREESEELFNYIRMKDKRAVNKLLSIVESQEKEYKEKHKYLVDSKNILDNTRRSILEAVLIDTPETERIKPLMDLIQKLDTSTS